MYLPSNEEMDDVVSALGEYRDHSKTIIARKPLWETPLFPYHLGLGQLYSLQGNSSIQYALFPLEYGGLKP